MSDMTPAIDRPIPRLDPAQSIDDIVRLFPTSAAVFDAFAVDTRRGRRSLRDAAREHGADCCTLLAALEWAASESGAGA